MNEISTSYNPKEVEEKWYEKWINSNAFKADVNDLDRDAYCVMIPPPNVTGVLTMGHVLNNTIQDILVRRARQEGKNALWLPGTDHAGIATQTKVEQALRKEGKDRRELGREKFLERAREWRDAHGGIIIQQLKRLGASCDWSRCVHTLDADYSHAVIHAFVELFKRGYIYRGKRIVNWCPVSLTALSDEEVIMKPMKGKIYKIKYEFVDEAGQYLEVCTTRPETVMGDVAIAVNPKDKRYKHLIGKQVWRPLERAAIPIIADSAVEIDFGTGVLKVTPAHDAADFGIGARHNLEIRDVMNVDGTMNKLAGKAFEGMERFDARRKAAEILQEQGLLISEELYHNNVGFSERADVPIEPRISEQWFMKYPKIEEAKEIVRSGKIKFWPPRWEKTYLHWLDNIQDWCISRQLWWGHRIPVWYKKGEDRSDPANWHISVNGPEDAKHWEQDEDVLDTWASSWLWPFATLGWPVEKDMEEGGLYKFFPTNDLVTGPDIIFFWVARMIIAGLEFMGPEKERLEVEELDARKVFSDVYFTGIVRDSQGRKMSKSLGNSPDPIDLINKYGADGLRFGTISIAPQGQDIMFSEDRIDQGKKFCNKLWNACRFRQVSGEMFDNHNMKSIIERMNDAHFDADDHSILDKLVKLMDSVKKSFKNYEFSQIVGDIYTFFWADYCDWYVEVSKTKLQHNTLKNNCLAIHDLIIRETLMMLHPFIPFITEELWHKMNYGTKDKFIGQQYIGDGDWLLKELEVYGVDLNKAAIKEIEQIRDFVSKARALKAAFQLASKKNLNFTLVCSEEQVGIIGRHKEKLLRMIGAAGIKHVEHQERAPAEVTELGTLYLLLEGELNIDEELERLNKDLEKLKRQVAIGESKFSDEKFIKNAPASIIEGAKLQLQETRSKFEEVKRLIEMLSD